LVFKSKIIEYLYLIIDRF